MADNAKPMMIAIIEHDMEHPVTDLNNPAFFMQWLAFNPTTRKVMVEVEATTPAGLQAFRNHYGIGQAGAKGEARDNHALPDNPAEWRSLIGERETDDDLSDPMKHIKRITRLRSNLQREDQAREVRRLRAEVRESQQRAREKAEREAAEKNAANPQGASNAGNNKNK